MQLLKISAVLGEQYAVMLRCVCQVLLVSHTNCAGFSWADHTMALLTAPRGIDTVTLPYFPFTAPLIVNPAYLAFIPFVPGDPTGSWSITATDSMGMSAPAMTPPIADPELVPFVTDVMVSDNSTTPTVSWTLPDLTGFDVELTRLRIIDVMTEVQLSGLAGLGVAGLRGWGKRHEDQ